MIDEKAMVSLKNVSVSDLHGVLGHPSYEIVRATAKKLGLKLNGIDAPCESCAMGKAKAKAIVKVSASKSNIPGERLSLDLSSIKARSLGGSKYWLLIVDEATNMKWSHFLREKADLGVPMMLFIKNLHVVDGIKVKYIRCDNAGENRKLEELINVSNF
jgi:hypothetical protein